MPGANILQLTQDLHVTAGSQRKEVTGGTQQLFSVKYLLGETKIA